MRKVIDSVGGSIGWAGMGAVTSGAAIVSATVASVSPAMATMSPALASSIGRRSRPRKPSTLETRPSSTSLPSRERTFTGMFGRTAPEVMRPVRMRPR